MLKKLYYSLARIYMKTIGQTSDGVKMCFQHGLTSGKMLDYIYRNEPSGKFIIGKAIDKSFLNDPGWEAVRIRRRHLEQLAVQAVEQLRKEGKSVSILDVASGPGAYILSVMETVGGKELFARCRDFDGRWVKDGVEAARNKGLNNVQFEQGDAFNRDEILSLIPKPNIAVSSGFYDWFNDDHKVKESIQILYDALEPGGYFVLSNQTAHPKLEFTEAVFVDFNNEPLKMTMRTKETISNWLTDIGFEVQEILCDDNNYYSVTKARKPLN